MTDEISAQGDYPRDATIHGLFADQAARTPDTVAIVFGDEALTYQELDERSNRLARHLQSLGVSTGTPVGIHVERSHEMVVGVLGILKAGGAYVPLDPGYPLERLAFMLDDTRAPVLLTQERLEDSLPATWARVVLLDADAEEIGRHIAEPPATAATAESLAYVMYTSGSTGKPKGVAVVHRGVVRLVRGTDYASFGPDEVFLQLAPLSFDASTFEIWAPLLNGGSVAIFPPGTPALEDIGRAVRRHGVTTLWLTAGLFHLMVDERLEDLRGLRQLLAGGDVLSVPRVRRFLREAPRCRLINGYGPTESTTFAICHTVREVPEDATSIPIGLPIAHTEIRLLDSDGSPSSVGEPGEIHIGGDGLARGYWNRPELTEEKFIPHPFPREAGARLYRTGDLGRFAADGTIEFLGRVDQQVKIRGFRVELEEVETALAKHPDVREAAALAQEGPSGSKRLTGYVVLHGGATGSDDEIRRFLAQSLPDYMIPAEIVRVPAFPLNPNGKVDRAGLPAQAAAMRQVRVEPPDSSLEREIAGVWASVLGLVAVGREQNFFDLGGDSLCAVEVHAKLRRTLGADLSLTDLFEHTTVKALADHLQAASDAGGISRQAVDRGRRQRQAAMAQSARRPEAVGG